jgi:PAS domain S-box-containing protein
LLKKYSDIQASQTVEMARFQKEALLAVKEQANIENNNRFSYAAQATSDAIWDRNYSEDVVFWGDGYRTLFGYEITPETTSVNFWASKVHPEDLEGITKITREAKENPATTAWSGEYRFLKANGEYAFVREKAFIIRDETGVPCRTIGALQDVSEIKENELKLKSLNDSLQKEKYYLDSLMDNMPDAIYFKDKESKFLRVSKYMVSKHLADHPGATVNDLLGKSDIDLQDNDHAREAYRDEQEIQKTKKPKIDYIEKEIKNDGTERWVATTKLPLVNMQGEVVGTFGISRDITKLKELEKKQHEAQLDKAVAQGKFEIASDVMHDIGNAVVGFGSYLTRIKRLQEQGNQENLKNLIGFFESQRTAIAASIGETKADAVINMLSGIAQKEKNNQDETTKSITEQLNIIANIEEILNIQRQYITGHESKERKPANLKNIINDSLAMLFTSIDKKAVDISLNIAENLPSIKGDRTKLMQLVLNIVKNSIDATEENKTEKSICINAFTNAHKLIVEVKDNGSGFDSATAGKLFERGFTTKASSTGQSLYTCKTIVESHEGTIDITSEGPGKGTLTTIGFKILAA